jgi:hypothetical protein
MANKTVIVKRIYLYSEEEINSSKVNNETDDEVALRLAKTEFVQDLNMYLDNVEDDFDFEVK